MKSCLEICKTIGKMPNSKFKKDYTSLADVDDKAISALNEALQTIMDSTDGWQFRLAKKKLKIKSGVYQYSAPMGIIAKNGVTVNDTIIPYVADIETYSTSTTGTATKYGRLGDYIILYPTPNADLDGSIRYRTIYGVLASDSTEKEEFTLATDVLNINERYESIFIKCLGHLANVLLVGKQNNKHYLEHSTRYALALQALKRLDIGTEDASPQFVI